MAAPFPIMTAVKLAPILLAGLLLSGCYTMLPSRGGGQTEFDPPRAVSAADVLVPDGYRVEVVATGLTFPTGVTFDAADVPHVVEAGYSYGEVFTVPRLLRIGADGAYRVIATGENPPWNGVDFLDGVFYVAGGHVGGGEVLRITPDGTITVLIDGLPSRGDHHTNGPVAGPDGMLYIGQGTATNSGVVGIDNHAFGWLERNPDVHDVPCRDVTLTGQNFTTDNPLGEGRVTTGAFLPFGTPSRAGQVIRGDVRCSGAVLRISPGDGSLELVAWGLRNPFGLAFAPDGQLYVTDNSYDDRGSRPIWGSPDKLWHIEEGTWYGFPDFGAGIPATSLDPPGKPTPRFLLAEHPNEAPRPAVRFGVHSSSNGLDIARSAAFGFEGHAFVAQFGDMAPGVGKVMGPSGFRVARVDLAAGTVHGFMENPGDVRGPASLVGGGGIERPVAARFNPAGDALYVVDFGVMTVGERGPEPRVRTGVLWRVVRDDRP
jgi:glucose/arabinose dehydrogenase